jgi:hypothetical protein
MPPQQRLPDREIATIKRWVTEGAAWPSDGTPTSQDGVESHDFRVTEKQRTWWSFQSLKSISVPAVETIDWPRDDLDYFVLRALESRHMHANGEADRQTWLRRATFDLTGLPPTSEELESFMADTSDSAFDTVIDRLLASPAYGQRYARYWLDVVRYADYHDADAKARNPVCEPLEAWRYRNWVVNSFNQDMPFDQFIAHQIAGDLLAAPDGVEPYADGLIATTFLVNGAWDRGDADKEKMLSDMVDDQIDTIGKAFLGLTLGCARCHNHKFDPISQADYYGLAGIFYSTRMLTELGTKGGEITLQRRPLVPKGVVESRNLQTKQLNELNAKLAELDKQEPKPTAEAPIRVELTVARDRLQKDLLPEIPMALAVSEGGVPGGLFPGIQDVPIHIRGSYAKLGLQVPRHMPSILADTIQSPVYEGSGRRELAAWVACDQNPLTARVIVNRVWQWHFGQGLVGTANNFGLLSEEPSHSELLDWLAARFIQDGWSLKRLHRNIMLSATYRQSSQTSLSQFEVDPENRWLGRFMPKRLEAEAIRDNILAVTGQLDHRPQAEAQGDMTLPYRSLYLQTARWDRANFATLFDAANPDASVESRAVSTVAPQSLFLLNNRFLLDHANHFTQRLFREIPNDPNARIKRAYNLLCARSPTMAELGVAKELVAESWDALQADANWIDLAHVLLCSNEFIYTD